MRKPLTSLQNPNPLLKLKSIGFNLLTKQKQTYKNKRKPQENSEYQLLYRSFPTCPRIYSKPVRNTWTQFFSPRMIKAEHFHAISNLIPPRWAGSLTAQAFHLAAEPRYICKDKEAAIKGFPTTAEGEVRGGEEEKKRPDLLHSCLIWTHTHTRKVSIKKTKSFSDRETCSLTSHSLNFYLTKWEPGNEAPRDWAEAQVWRAGSRSVSWSYIFKISRAKNTLGIMLHYMEGFYPNVEQEGSHKQALVDFIMSQEWERIGKEHSDLGFFFF